jgi:hypothetical protein
MADIIDEIDERIKEENFHKFLKKILPYFVLAIFLTIALAAFYVWYNNRQIAFAQRDGDQLITAVEKFNEHPNESSKILEELMSSSSGDIPALSALLRAEIALENNDETKAADLLQQYAKTADNIVIEDLLKVLDISLYLDDKSKKDIVLGNIQHLISSNSPFKGSALILNGLYYLGENNNVEADKIFNQIIQDPELPPIIKDKARILSSVSKE